MIQRKRRISAKTSLHRLPPHLARYQRQQEGGGASSGPQRRPLPLWAKLIAVAGMLAFWAALMGWLPAPGKRTQMDLGFTLFCASQVPLLWCWIRAEHRRLREKASADEEEEV